MCKVAMKSELVKWRFICIFDIVWNSADCFSYRQFVHFTAAFCSRWVQVFQCLDVCAALATHLHYLFSRPSEPRWCSRHGKWLWSISNGLQELEKKIRITHIGAWKTEPISKKTSSSDSVESSWIFHKILELPVSPPFLPLLNCS